MRNQDRIPLVNKSSNVQDVILEITSKMLGICGVIDNGKMVGVITDGDIRRSFLNDSQQTAESIMTHNFKYLTEDMFADQAAEYLTSNKITSSIVLNAEMMPIGAINIHDLLK